MGAAFSAAGTFICWGVSAVCCACSLFQCCCTGAMGAKGVGKNMAKFIYVLLLGLATIIAYVIGDMGENRLLDEDAQLFQITIDCEDITGNTVCSGHSAIFRASCASVFFFAAMLLGTIPRPTFSGERNWVPLLGEGFHRGYWGFKLIIFFGLLIGSFFFPTSFFDDDVYRELARVVSVFFLAVQVLVLIDFAYTWNDNWVNRAFEDGDDEPTAKGWIYALIFFSVLGYIAAIGGLIALFVFYENCDIAVFFCTIALILFVLYTALSFLNVYVVNLFMLCFCREMYDAEDGVDASIAPASVVGAYCTFLLWSALRSNPDPSSECTPFDDFLQSNGYEIFLGIAFASLSLMWAAFAASSNARNLVTGQEREENDGAEGTGAYQIGENEDGTAKYAHVGEDDDEVDHDSQIWFFHFLMITASFYMAMVLTNWGVSELEILSAFNTTDPEVAATNGAGDVGIISMWVKITALWVASLLFMWTLVAPYIFEDREF